MAEEDIKSYAIKKTIDWTALLVGGGILAAIAVATFIAAMGGNFMTVFTAILP